MKRTFQKFLVAIGLAAAMVALAVPAGGTTLHSHVVPAVRATRLDDRATRLDNAGPDIWLGNLSFENYTKPSRCLGINSSGNAGLWNCTYKNDQEWMQGPYCNEDGYCQLENEDGYCLGVTGGSKKDGARVVGYYCEPTSHPDQYWLPDYDFACPDGNNLHLINMDNVVIGTSGGRTANGTPVVIWSNQRKCNNQLWLSVSP
jgi:hypothetical protein